MYRRESDAHLQVVMALRAEGFRPSASAGRCGYSRHTASAIEFELLPPDIGLFDEVYHSGIRYAGKIYTSAYLK